MNLTLKNLHPLLNPPPVKWRNRIRSILRLVQEDKSRYPAFHFTDISVVWFDDRMMAEMNQRFLEHEGPTDIITFDYGHGMGELLISLDTAKKAGSRHGNSLDEELTLYVVHGILHLAGYQDKTLQLRQKMKREENRVLKKLKRK